MSATTLPRRTDHKIHVPWSRQFYLLMSLTIVVVIVAGFSFTIDGNLIHPAVPRPWILYLHAAVFTSWLPFLVLQSALVRLRKVTWHRQIGWIGVALGSLISVVGVSTALVMARFNSTVLRRASAQSDLIIPLFDMVCFTTAFALAVYWRKKPELHRRLMLIASCVLTAAAFGRFPGTFMSTYFYLGVDLLIFFGVVRDMIVDHRIHRVYLVAFPLLVLGQAVTVYTFSNSSAFWLRIAQSLIG